MFDQLFEMAMNPYGRMLKQPMMEVLGNRYPKHQEILERLSRSMATQPDMEKFLAMIIDVYEVAYTKAVDEQREALRQRGFDVSIKKPKEEPKPEIFT